MRRENKANVEKGISAAFCRTPLRVKIGMAADGNPRLLFMPVTHGKPRGNGEGSEVSANAW
jgi:hypothetical protein